MTKILHLVARITGSLRVYGVLLALLLLGFPIIFLAISIWPRHQAWGFIQKIFRLTLWAAGIHVEQFGIEKVPPSAPAILMGNHVNWLDHLILATALPTPLVGFEKTENFKIPIYGPMMRRWGNVEVRRRADLQEAMQAAENAAKILAQGCWFLVFPEGTRTRNGELGAFKKGGFHMAVDANAVIVPFAFTGARDIMAAGKWWISPGCVTVRFAAPIYASQFGKPQLESLMTETRTAILQLLDPGDAPDSAQPVKEG
ncbi:MAG: lysophospholipid acyltransferase family protein [Candidatus Sericytochromatia bacterium]|nr:lysophospholipid acyltransferase family protein [Candidatus Sericytochromatia bacterium]